MDIIADYKQIHWLCQTCDGKINEKIQNLSTDTSSSNKALSEIVTESLDKVVGQFTAALKDTQDFIKQSFEQIVDAPAGDMETSHAATQPNTSTHVNGRNAVEAVDEYVERERRKCNVIIHNLPEPGEVSSGEQLRQKDKEKVCSLISTEFKINDFEVQRTVRLGSHNPSSPKPRLLLVELKDISTKRQILRQATSLRKSSTWSNIYISPDLTPKERAHNKKLREELKSRKDAGEKNIFIKHGRIISRPADDGTSSQAAK